MRTTVTLDSDTERLLRTRMKEQGVSFKVALNDSIRKGLATTSTPSPFVAVTADMGLPTINLDRALQLTAELEDEDLLRKRRLGK